jgi:hypothetical protein
MNFAFPALLIFLIALPGVVLRQAAQRGVRGLPVEPRGLTEQVAEGVLIAAVLHFLWLAALVPLTRWLAGLAGVDGIAEPDLRPIAYVLLGSYGANSERLDEVVGALTESPSAAFFYFASMYTFALLAGFVLHERIRRWPRVRKHPMFGFRDDWHRLFEDVGSLRRGVDSSRTLVFLSAVVEIGGEGYVYDGLVHDFVYDDLGRIDRFVLQFAARRPLKHDGPPRGSDADARDALGRDGQFYEIAGDFFVLRYSETTTLNVRYLEISE